MNLIGIGVDMERVERFRHFKNDSRDPFLQRTFTQAELKYCFGEAAPAEHLAGRFAAKEAVMKALADDIHGTVAYNEIEIKQNDKGAPVVALLRSGLSAYDIQVSISHTSEAAVAVVVVMSNR